MSPPGDGDRYPDRATRLVFLDAAFDVNASDSVIGRRPVRRPAPVGLRSREDVTRWLARYFYGAWTPALEAEYRARPDDDEAPARPRWRRSSPTITRTRASSIACGSQPWRSARQRPRRASSRG